MSCMLLLAYWESSTTICGHSFTNHYPGCALPDPFYAAENSTNMKLKVSSSINHGQTVSMRNIFILCRLAARISRVKPLQQLGVAIEFREQQ